MRRLFVLLMTIILLTACGSSGKDTQKIEVEEEIELNNVTLEVQSIHIKDNEAKVYIAWKHWTSYDKAHLDLLLTTSIKQDGEELEIIKGEDKYLKQVDKGVGGSVNATYKLIDNETPIEIKFIETTDEAKEESITVDIKE